MNSNLDKEQLYNICSGLLKGFIDWIDINSQDEKALILDSAYQFKNQILIQDNPSLQKKYFVSPQDLSNQEALMLLNQWKETFSNLINSDVDRISKDSFKIWFLSLASEIFEELNEAGRLMWKTLILGIDHCKKFSLNDIPRYHNKFSSN